MAPDPCVEAVVSATPLDPGFKAGDVIFCDELSYYQTRSYYCCAPRWACHAGQRPGPPTGLCDQPITHLVPLTPTCRPLQLGVQAPEAGWRLLRLDPV